MLSWILWVGSLVEISVFLFLGFFFFFFFDKLRIKLEVTIGDFGIILIFTFVLSSVIDLNNKEIDFVC
jgi:hypothetical protein